jgi:hypothetical protein
MISVATESDLVDLDGVHALAKMTVKPNGFLFDGAFQGTKESEDTSTEIGVRKVETAHRRQEGQQCDGAQATAWEELVGHEYFLLFS